MLPFDVKDLARGSLATHVEVTQAIISILGIENNMEDNAASGG